MKASVTESFDSYPVQARHMLMRLRVLILEVASENDIGPVEESLKWGEPSFSVKGASPVRIDWKEKYPDKCFVFFQCQTSLVETFKEIYGDTFSYDGKRAIVLDLSKKHPQELPVLELKHCIALSLAYHKLKHLPLLGARSPAG